MKTYKANNSHGYLKNNTKVSENGNLLSYPSKFAVPPDQMPDWYDEVEPPRWRAEEGGRYYYILSDNNASEAFDCFGGLDDIFYNIGNYFQTKEQAEEYARRCKALTLEYHKEIGV